MSDVKIRPVSFNSEMAKAIVDGRKTMTRRVVKPQPESVKGWAEWAPLGEQSFPDPPASQRYGDLVDIRDAIASSERCSNGQPGDRLWVREPAVVVRTGELMGERQATIKYLADGEQRTLDWPERIKPVPTSHGLANGCFREASRILLEVTDVRVERVQDITNADAVAEGIHRENRTCEDCWDRAAVRALEGEGSQTDHYYKVMKEAEAERRPCTQWAIGMFTDLWDSVSKTETNWAANPWVWVVVFKRVKL